ncbi:MAG: dihydroorotase [Gammaproteobacteria bacterium]|nr:dihydroorotase [Gammaproteobacteria bacterium]
MSSLIITNATLVNEGSITQSDVLIRNGRIEKIAPHISAEAETIIDAKGKYLLPGMIDDQVHFREPGLTHKGRIVTESKACIMGGITSFMEMPNTKPPAVTRASLEDKYAMAKGNAYANYSFYLGATNDNIEEIKAIDPANVCGVKVFMGASTGNMLVDEAKTLEGIFRESPMIIATHCENTPTILANEAKWREQYGEQVPFNQHGIVRSREACYASSSSAVGLAKKYDAPLHVLHITTKEECDLFAAGDLAGKPITAEACVHHLWFTDADYDLLGGLIKCNPAIKTLEDREAIRAAVRDGRIDVIATDHAPHTWDEKQQSYFGCPSGLPLVQYALPALLTLVNQGVFSIEQVVHKTSHAVAARYGMIDRGFIREGYWADLVLVDMKQPIIDTPDRLAYLCGWSPFNGQEFSASISSTFVNGQLVYHNGETVHRPVGQRLAFQAQRR